MALKSFAFKVLKEDKFARCGLIETHRGNIKTPAFMPVGTQATIKACTTVVPGCVVIVPEDVLVVTVHFPKEALLLTPIIPPLLLAI